MVDAVSTKLLLSTTRPGPFISGSSHSILSLGQQPLIGKSHLQVYLRRYYKHEARPLSCHEVWLAVHAPSKHVVLRQLHTGQAHSGALHGYRQLAPITHAESLTEEELEEQEALGDQAGSSLAVSHLCRSADADGIVGCVQRPLLMHIQCFPLARMLENMREMMTQIRPLLFGTHWQCSVTVTFRVMLSAACADMLRHFLGDQSRKPHRRKRTGAGKGKRMVCCIPESKVWGCAHAAGPHRSERHHPRQKQHHSQLQGHHLQCFPGEGWLHFLSRCLQLPLHAAALGLDPLP